jgi:GNAT superfamily N-acetyltransferase
MIAVMDIRKAQPDDADEACVVMRRSIVELCQADHRNDAATIAAWTANKTAENFRSWLSTSHVFVACEGRRILAVGALKEPGEIVLNYVTPDARFQGISKALMERLETCAREFGARAVTLHSTRTAQPFYKASGYRVVDGPEKIMGLATGIAMAKDV